MDKKLDYIFAVLVAGLFVVSACDLSQSEVGARLNRNVADAGKDNKLLAHMECNVEFGANGQGRWHCTIDCNLGQIQPPRYSEGYGTDVGTAAQNAENNCDKKAGV